MEVDGAALSSEKKGMQIIFLQWKISHKERTLSMRILLQKK